MKDQIKGPWVMVPKLSASENHRGYRIADANNWYFAEVMPLDSDGIDGKVRARLIAAAPDMLQALRKIVERLEWQWPSDEPDLLEARAAISKATEGE